MVSAFFLRIRRTAGDASHPILAESERSGGAEIISLPPSQSRVTGVKRWLERDLSMEDLRGALEKGHLVDGSYFLVCVDSRTVSLWSDPLGTIPGYYSVTDGFVVVGTNALEVARCVHDRLDENTSKVYVLFDYVPQPGTLFSNVVRCPPGSVVEISTRTGQVSVRRYFCLFKAVTDKLSGLRRSISYLQQVVHESWLASVKKALRSLPSSERIGVSISGGLDSRYLMCAAKEQGLDLISYTYSSVGNASDALLARRSAESIGIPWEHVPIVYSSREMARFMATYGGMEPASMSFLPSVANRLRATVRLALVAAGGDVIWGSHLSVKLVAKIARSWPVWRRYCRSRTAAWVASSELGDVSWATMLPGWKDYLALAAEVFDASTQDWDVDRLLAERLWSVCYRQPSYTWNSNLVYEDNGITVICPTLTLDSVVTGLALPVHACWEGRAYASSLARFYPAVSRIPLTRTRLDPRAGLVRSELGACLLFVKRFAGLDWYVPWVRQEDWLPVWQQVMSASEIHTLDKTHGNRLPPGVRVRLGNLMYLVNVLGSGGHGATVLV